MTDNKLEYFKDKNILVVGDVMLDKYLIGEVERISPEAPVPVVHIKKENFTAGGAANVANNIRSLNGKVTLIGIIGDDEAGKKLKKILYKNKINFKPIVLEDSSTIQKIRILSQNQQLLRIDYENKSIDSQNKIIKTIDDLVEDNDLVVVSDYAKGVIKEKVMNYLKRTAKKLNKKIIVDPKPKNAYLYNNVFLITPNQKEAMEIYGRDDKINKIGKYLFESLNSNILITRGEKGMSLFEKNKKPVHISTKAKSVYDVSGAGDTVIATLSLCIASNLELLISAEIANYAAGIVVGKLGTATVSRKELLEYIKNNNYKLYDMIK